MSNSFTVRCINANNADEVLAQVEALAEVLIDCVAAGASVSFMHPLAAEKAIAFWHGVVNAVARGERLLFIAQQADGHLLGTVQLILDQPENQPHRADLAKMLVRPEARRRGVARRLLQAVDESALQAGKSVLVLDTVTGGAGDHLYAQCGWQRVGDVPNYALMPDGMFCATTFYYKHL